MVKNVFNVEAESVKNFFVVSEGDKSARGTMRSMLGTDISFSATPDEVIEKCNNQLKKLQLQIENIKTLKLEAEAQYKEANKARLAKDAEMYTIADLERMLAAKKGIA